MRNSVSQADWSWQYPNSSKILNELLPEEQNQGLSCQQ